MPTQLAAPAAYKKLVADIAALYEGARKALVGAYWQIGQRIVEVEQNGALKAKYGDGLLANLSEDLSKQCGSGFSESHLRRMRQFYLAYPIRAAPHELNWAQYAELLPIENPEIRERLAKRALREGLNHKALRKLVQAEHVRAEVAEKLAEDSDSKTPPELLVPQKGTLYTYRITQPKLVGPEDSELLIDLGFSNYKDLDTVTSRALKAGDIVESLKTGDEEYKAQKSERKETDLFTYSAEVEKVVDGDTLRVVADLGFGIKTRQYLRLRGINCPEMDTPEGKKAADFVKARIRVASEILLTSSKSDKYDRYLANIFYLDPQGKEVYLNNALLENGLAVRMRE